MRCAYDAEGNEKDCCDVCMNTSSPYYAARCTVDGVQGPSICGTTKGHCYYCDGAPGRDSQGDCEDRGSCTVEGATSQSDCTNRGTCTITKPEPGMDSLSGCNSRGGQWTPGVWTAAVWKENTTATTAGDESCESVNRCGKCSGQHHAMSKEDCEMQGTCSKSMYMDKNSCEMAGDCSSGDHMDSGSCTGAGGTWTAATWTPSTFTWHDSYSTESSCRNAGAENEYTWVRYQRYESGEVIKPAAIKSEGCSTGHSHEIDGLYRNPTNGAKECVSGDMYFADAAAGKTFSEANSSNPAYYEKIMDLFWGRAQVANHPNAVDHAQLRVAATSCFFGFPEATNHAHGSIKVTGGANTNILLYKATNAADAQEIVVNGGRVSVIGATNAGSINIQTDKQVSVYDVENSGPIQVSESQEIVLASIVNKVGGTVVATSVSATLIDIENEASITVKGTPGVYNAFNIVNKASGSITIEVGTINISTICPSAGTITISNGVTGVITHEPGCKGTITAPDTVDIIVAGAKKEIKIEGTLSMTVPDPDALLTDTDAQAAIAEGIADAIGVSKDYVSVQVTKARRLELAWHSVPEPHRRLAGGVTVQYTISIPATESTAVAQVAEAKVKSITKEELTTNVQAKVVAAKGSSYGTITVTEKATPSITESTPTPNEGSASGAEQHCLLTSISLAVLALVGMHCSKIS